MAEEFLIYLENDQGEEVEYTIVASFIFEDKNYMALLPTGVDGEYFLIGYHPGPNDEVIFDPIEDERLFEGVAYAFNMEMAYLEAEDIQETAGELETDEELCLLDEWGRPFTVDEENNRIYMDEPTVSDNWENRDPWDN